MIHALVNGPHCASNLKDKTYNERMKFLGLPSLEYRRQRADMVETYKIMEEIDKIDKTKLFTMAKYKSTRGHSRKIFKRRSRLNLRANVFSNRICDNWNNLPEQIVSAPSLNAFKSRLNKHWHGHPTKFNPSCYDTYTTRNPNILPVTTTCEKASEEADKLD